MSEHPEAAYRIRMKLEAGTLRPANVRRMIVIRGPSYHSDLQACEHSTPPGIDERGERFAGCMVSAGHAAWLQVGSGEEFWVRQTRSHDRQTAASDLVQCYKTVKTERALGDCLAPRGYAIQRYEPPRR